jgi:hypothetical protein
MKTSRHNSRNGARTEKWRHSVLWNLNFALCRLSLSWLLIFIFRTTQLKIRKHAVWRLKQREVNEATVRAKRPVLRDQLTAVVLFKSWQSQVESNLMLRPTVSRPVYLRIKRPFGAYDQIFIIVRQLRVGWCWALLSLTRGRVCRLQLLLALASAVILGSESRGTRDHILLSQIRDFLFVASCDSQGYGGGILPRLHTECRFLSKSKSKSHCDWRSVN